MRPVKLSHTVLQSDAQAGQGKPIHDEKPAPVHTPSPRYKSGSKLRVRPAEEKRRVENDSVRPPRREIDPQPSKKDREGPRGKLYTIKREDLVAPELVWSLKSKIGWGITIFMLFALSFAYGRFFMP
jgi:hypothetical protein